jgi:sugar phosphate isomerase/epimerase
MIELATMSSVCPDWDLGEVIAGMKRHGYKGFEPRVEWGHACGIEADLGGEKRREIKRRLADEDLVVCCVATGVRMATADASERAGHIEDLKRYIDLAADLGCGLVRTFGGQRTRDREWQWVVDYVVEGYMQVMDQAEERGVVVLMETHDDWSCSAPVRAVVEQAEQSNLKVLWDFMHPQRMLEKPEESFSVLADYTRHLHAHDGSYVDGRMQVGALGEGVIDHQVPLQLLKDAGFAGYFSVEVIHKPGSKHDADGVLRQYAEQFAKIMAAI